MKFEPLSQEDLFLPSRDMSYVWYTIPVSLRNEDLESDQLRESLLRLTIWPRGTPALLD